MPGSREFNAWQFDPPEHQKDYRFRVGGKLTGTAFTSRPSGICPMPDSLATGRFDLNEMARTAALGRSGGGLPVLYLTQ